MGDGMELNYDDEPIQKGTCDYCGKENVKIFAPNYADPYMTELYPEEEDIFVGDWCESCWDQRKGEI